MPQIKIDEDTQPEDVKDEAEGFYNAYIKNSDGKAWDGRQCPAWEDLTSAVRSHWCAVALHARGE